MERPDQEKTFLQIFQSLTGETPSAPDSPAVVCPPTGEPDSLELSVQAKNALDVQKTKPVSKDPDTAETPNLPGIRADAQGNRVRISIRGSSLAARARESVVWETGRTPSRGDN